MRHMSQFSKYLLLFAILAFFFVGFLGLGHTSMDISADRQTSASNCFMPGMTEVLCQMNPLEHIAEWQSMFTAAPNQNDVLMFLLALLALVLGTLFLHSHQSTAPPKILVSQFKFLYYKRHIPIVSPLQEAFSNGILHPKLYNATLS